MHLKRWLTSIIALPIVIYLIAKGGIYFVLLICAVCLISIWEYYRIVLSDNNEKGLIPEIGMVSGGLLIFAAAYGRPSDLLFVFAFNFVVCALICVLKTKDNEALPDIMARQVQGMIYIPLMLTFLVFIRTGESGAIWVFFLICVVFGGDIGAYYMGTYLGKHKLMPSVSPKKTLEGAIGGIGANLLIGSLININLPHLPWGLNMPALPWIPTILFLIVVGMIGQFGDLFESLFKRAADIKDSGKILPGHGGLLDRIDALLFAAPLAYFYKTIVIAF